MNMSTHNHPIEQEELMAYLDGELATDRAVEAAAHLERCAECQELVAELKKISQEMMAWEIESAEPSGMSTEVAVALIQLQKKAQKSAKWRMRGILITPRRLAWSGGIVAAFFVIGVLMTRQLGFAPQAVREKTTQNTIETYLTPAAPTPAANYDAYVSTTDGIVAGKAERGQGSAGKLRSSTAFANDTEDRTREGEESEANAGVPEIPMIARTAGMTLVAKEFDKTRAELEAILKRHNGYVGEMSVSAPSDAGRTLTATLRVPAPQLDAALSELKQLGRVENESQGGEEVTAQYVDVEARLKNAQHTEQRLTEILRSRTGKLQDVLKVELEIDRVRGEIEQMQAEKKELTKRVAFSTVNTTIKEEYHAKLQTAPPSTGSRFHNAAVDGYNSVIEGLVSVGLFLLSAGPSLLIWAAILFFPVRWLWRKVRAELKKSHESAAS
jgi:Domain of unknown function (DUF4349)/Putative zinc-finger